MMAIVGGTNSRVTMEDVYQKISSFYKDKIMTVEADIPTNGGWRGGLVMHACIAEEADALLVKTI